MTTYSTAIQAAIKQLSNSTSPRLDALLLLSHVQQKPRTYLLAHLDDTIEPVSLAHYQQIVSQRAAGTPIAYLIGRREFYGRQFQVNPSVLIPRPETEVIIEQLKHILPQPHTILDVGTGSGCLAITAQLELGATVTACDLSPQALATAQTNATALRATIQFLQSNLLSKVTGQFDCMLANLPYLDQDAAADYCGKTTPTDLASEPKMALFAADGGKELIKQLIAQAPAHLSPHGHLILELNPEQLTPISDYAKAYRFSVVEAAPFTLHLQLN